MRGFDQMLQQGELAVVQGVGYPNPDRSHFESMDIWQIGRSDAQDRQPAGSAAASTRLHDATGGIPIMHIGPNRSCRWPCQGATSGAISINNQQPYRLELGGGDADQQKARRKLIEDLAQRDKDDDGEPAPVRRPPPGADAVHAGPAAEVLKGTDDRPVQRLRARWSAHRPQLAAAKLQLIAQLIQKGFGTRVFYVMRDGFDTHSDQAEPHGNLLAEVADGITTFFETLAADRPRQARAADDLLGVRPARAGERQQGHRPRRRLRACSWLGRASRAGPVGKHPSLNDLDDGDLKYHTDFRQVYATLLDHWLGCDSKSVLGGKFEHLDALS